MLALSSFGVRAVHHKRTSVSYVLWDVVWLTLPQMTDPYKFVAPPNVRDSEQYTYTETTGRNLQWVLAGQGASPALWCKTEWVFPRMFNGISEFQSTFSSPLRVVHLLMPSHLQGIAFTDDTAFTVRRLRMKKDEEDERGK